MHTEDKKADVQESVDKAQQAEALELVLFQVSECYVYMESSNLKGSGVKLMYPTICADTRQEKCRADEWDVNKWACDGVLKVISKGQECIIKLEDKKAGELFARAFLRHGEAHPVEPVIDSSRYFVLRIKENIGLEQQLRRKGRWKSTWT
ncbi:uncharacterized protein At1g03900-like isoform X2 [Neltuma alba]|uniref:uncharacterized protein At1g03900-like isoform X2 n=1 Tax=Neltuma alba TaxID=207710 RepID=UPI0010A46BEC|nr:uncharacterized protein At1g03900-like isoform X2 [Prosopis alba]XP_028807793.1 uncharacterized protein At1g03900-like isoform X2 [Prosopis alba]